MWVFLILMSLVGAQIVQDGVTMNVEDCKEKGFNPETLKCSVCKDVRKFNLEHLMSDCQSCCIKEKELYHEKYPHAELQFCECNLAQFPQVEAFVRKNMASRWRDKVKTRHMWGVRPQIVLKDVSGMSRQTLNVEKWTTDTIIDFLHQSIEV